MKAYWLLLALGAAWMACGDDDDDGSDGPAAGSQGSGRSGDGGGGAGGSAGANDAGNGGKSGSGAAGGMGGAPGGSGGAGGSAAAGGGGAGAGLCMGRTTNHTSGSRVRIKHAVTSEGDRAWLGFRDTELDLDCAFALAADGTMRCVPGMAAVRYFTDASCTDPVYSIPGQCEIDYLLVADASSDPCVETKYRVLERGAMFTGSVFQGSGTACAAATPADGRVLVRAGSEHPASEYAQGTRATWGSGSLATDGVEADGGLRNARGFRNTALDEACWFQAFDDGKQRCIEAALNSGFFADASCSEALAYDGTTCGKKMPTYLLVRGGAACGGDVQLRKVGAPHTGPKYASSSGTCAVSMSSAGGDLYSTVPVELSELPEVELTIDTSNPGRLQPSYRHRSDGGCWFDAWYDTALGERCHFDEHPDGKSYCLPEASYATFERVFGDAGCTNARTLVSTTACGADAFGPFVMERDGPLCVLEQRYRLLGKAMTAAALPELWFRDVVGDCQPFAPTQSHYAEVGAAVALSELMSGEIEIE